MGWFSNLYDAISDGLQTMVDKVCDLGKAIAESVANFAVTVGTFIEKGATWLAETLGPLLRTIGQALGILRPGEEVEDMGERALQAREAGITLESCQDFDDYMAKLRAFEIDPDKAAQRPQAEKFAAGMAIGTVGVSQRLGIPQETVLAGWLLALVNPAFFGAERLLAILSQPEVATMLASYLRGQLSPDQGLQWIRQIHDLDRRTNPDADLLRLREQFAQAHEALRGVDRDPAAVLERLAARHQGPQGV